MPDPAQFRQTLLAASPETDGDHVLLSDLDIALARFKDYA